MRIFIKNYNKYLIVDEDLKPRIIYVSILEKSFKMKMIKSRIFFCKFGLMMSFLFYYSFIIQKASTCSLCRCVYKCSVDFYRILSESLLCEWPLSNTYYSHFWSSISLIRLFKDWLQIPIFPHCTDLCKEKNDRPKISKM